MSDFDDFMMGNAGAVDEEAEFKLPRFKTAFKLKAMTAGTEEDCRREATTRVKRDGRYVSELDTIKYNNLLAVNTIVYPNLNNKELQDSYGAKNAVQLVTKMFKAGEMLALQNKISDINGFGASDEDLAEEAKN